MKGAIQKKSEALKKNLGEFGEEFMMQETKYMMKKFGADYLETELRKFIKLEKEASSLIEKNEKANKAHQEMTIG